MSEYRSQSGKGIDGSGKGGERRAALNHQGIPQVVVDKAREIRRSPVENLAGWNKDGEPVGHFKGDADSVSYPYHLEKEPDQGFDLHNHPPENGRYFEAPTDEDFVSAVHANLKAFYVVTREFLYQVRMPKAGWSANAIDNFLESYERNRAKIAVKLTQSLRNRELTFEELQDIERHLIWKEVAKELKFKYKRFKVSEL